MERNPSAAAGDPGPGRLPDGPVYELVVFREAEVASEFALWLDEQVASLAGQPGIADVRVLPLADDGGGRSGHVLHLRFADDEALDDFLGRGATRLASALRDRFGEHADSSARVLRVDRSVDRARPASCLNCGTVLLGQYCAECGQRSQSRLISLFELVRDAFGDMFELDSRLWKTLIPLLARPGALTRDYLEGKRARFMPPFRMYLVLSLVFFLVAFFDPKAQFGLLMEDEGAPASVGEPATAADGNGAPARAEPPVRVDADIGGVRLGIFDDEDADCDFSGAGMEDMPEWLGKRLTPARMKHVCEQVRRDDGRELLDRAVDNIPTALIVLLPVMAFVLVLLYPLSRRYYVEHLLFLVHFHSFFFLLLTLEILVTRAIESLPIPGSAASTATSATVTLVSVYVPVYLFLALRRVYGQGRIATFFKFVALVLAYLVSFVVMLVGAILYAVLTI